MAKAELTIEPGQQRVRITREFNAPRDLVFRAFTEPELIAQWWGPRGLTTRIDVFELRDGGRWRFVQTDPQGNEYGFHGVHHGTPSPDGMTRTFEFEGVPGHVSLESMVLEARGDKTLARMNVAFQSVEDRDGMVQAGMEGGMQESYERMDEILAGMGR
jgi:uncharacterized protein YndB with AHSA1/START domain